MSVRGIRGAVTATENTKNAMHEATTKLLGEIARCNHLDSESIAAVYFTTTPDLTAEFPAAAARAIGWGSVPLLCASEIAVAGALPLCIRVLVLANVEVPQAAIHHVYLGAAAALRPDLIAKNAE